MRFALAAWFTDSAAALTTVVRSRARTFSRSLPETMRDTSSTSSMSLVCARAFRSMTATARAAASGGRFPCIRRAVHPTMALSGVRSSWDRVARNWSFIRFADSASA